jgi:hypothetical protein
VWCVAVQWVVLLVDRTFVQLMFNHRSITKA